VRTPRETFPFDTGSARLGAFLQALEVGTARITLLDARRACVVAVTKSTAGVLAAGVVMAVCRGAAIVRSFDVDVAGHKDLVIAIWKDSLDQD
jgi:hypothetical protein